VTARGHPQPRRVVAWRQRAHVHDGFRHSRGRRHGLYPRRHADQRRARIAAHDLQRKRGRCEGRGIAGLEGSRDVIDGFRAELAARRDLFYRGVASLGGVLSGDPPKGAFYAFLRFAPDWKQRAQAPLDEEAENESTSWALVSYLIRHGRVGCVAGVDFGPGGEEPIGSIHRLDLKAGPRLPRA